MSHRSLARLDRSTVLTLGHTITKVAIDQGVQDAWRGAANDSSAAMEAVASAAESIATAAGSIVRASAITAAARRACGGLR